MAPLARGDRVGRYELLDPLGEGGMGTVWLVRARDASGDTLYAMKTVSATYASDPGVRAMFVKEATIAAALDHPNIVRLVDVGIHRDLPFFVMEWIDGFSLRNVARTVTDTGKRVPAGIALRIASDLCAGLHAAHELRGEDGKPLGLVHRDVSPQNVLVTREGIAKLIDFGVAKARGIVSNSERGGSGGIKGKVRYMAPEQALDKPIDRRADLFSVGAIVYRLLTGRSPFEGPNELAIINALLSSNPVFVPDDLPRAVQWILERALARRPENRFRTAKEMQEAIEIALSKLEEADTHTDVAKCLAEFDPRGATPPQGEETPESTGRASLYTSRSTTPDGPQLAFAAAASRPRTPPAFPNAPLLAGHRERVRAETRGSWNFVLLGAGFVGLLGVLAALLTRDVPTKSRAAAIGDTEASIADAPLPTPPGADHSVFVDLGDLDDSPHSVQSARPLPRPPSSAPPAPRGPGDGPLSPPK